MGVWAHLGEGSNIGTCAKVRRGCHQKRADDVTLVLQSGERLPERVGGRRVRYGEGIVDGRIDDGRQAPWRRRSGVDLDVFGTWCTQ